MKNTTIKLGENDNHTPTPPGKKPKKPVKTPPDHPGVPPNRNTPPYIEDPEPEKPKKIV